MPVQDEHNNKADQPQAPNGKPEDAASPFKALALAVGGLVLLLSIFALLPMFFTYLSEGDARAPSEIHATDSARKSSQNAYHLVKPEK